MMQEQIHAPPPQPQPTYIAATDSCSQDDQENDLALVRFSQVEPLAFGHLYEKYHDRVFWYLLARTGNKEDAADLTQQVFLKSLAALTQYQPHRGPFVAWLFGIARNSATNFQHRRMQTVAWENMEAEAATLKYLNDPESSFVERESLAQLWRLCAALAPAKQELLTLRFVAGLTSAEIGATIGKSEAAVKKQLTRILHHLKEQFYDLSS